MDIQEAIHVLQDCGDAAKGTEFEQVYRMGAAALQEQAEREKGCKYYRGEYNISTVSVARHTSDDETVMPIETSFCPHCGKRLK